MLPLSTLPDAPDPVEPMPTLLLLLCLMCCVPPQALNEFDLRATDWRKKLESQRGAVLAFETKVSLALWGQWMLRLCIMLAVI